MKRRLLSSALGAFASLCAACASMGTLARLVQPPRFEQDGDRAAEIRLLAPSRDQPLGGAAVRIWAKVLNPNPFGLTLSTVKGTLLLDGTRAATGDFPLGLPSRPDRSQPNRSISRSVSRICRVSPTCSGGRPQAGRSPINSTARSAWTRAAWVSRRSAR